MWINRHGLQRTDEIIPSFEISSLREIQGIIETLS
jgi:putative hydrolase of the HAD superfamily